MRWLRGLLPLLALGAVLASCTGTTENVPPLLLAVGRVDTSVTPAQPQMVLVEDNFASNLTVARDLTVVAGSARDLPFPAVASDVVDRAGSRSTLAVLSRDLTVAGGATPAPASYLLTFNLQGIDPASPTAFTQDSSLQLTGAAGAVFPPGSSGSPWCFSGISVSRTGRYVTLLDDPAACGDTSGRYPRLFQLDTGVSPVTVTPVEVAGGGVQTTQATVPYDDQATTDELLYFLVPGVSDAQVYADPVPHLSTTTPSTAIANLPTQQQTGLLGNGDEVLAITNQDPTRVNGSTSQLEAVSVTSPHTVTHVPTVAGARALAVDTRGITAQAVVAGSSQLAVHTTPSDGTPAKTAVGYVFTGVAAAIDPINQFAYVVDDKQIVVLDLLTVAGGSGSWYAPFSPDLRLPVSAATGQEATTVAWTRASP